MKTLAHSPKRDNPPADIPEPWSTIIDLRCAADARWFAAHPGRREFTRAADPGEFYPADVPDGALVRVTQLAPGVRTRQVTA